MFSSVFSNNSCTETYEWLSLLVSLLVEFATFKFATCSLLTCRIRYLLHSSTVNYAHIMNIMHQFPQMIYGNFCGSYLKKILSSSTKDSSYKHMASPWELRHQLLLLNLQPLFRTHKNRYNIGKRTKYIYIC